jgi:hypothetical protein
MPNSVHLEACSRIRGVPEIGGEIALPQRARDTTYDSCPEHRSIEITNVCHILHVHGTHIWTHASDLLAGTPKLLHVESVHIIVLLTGTCNCPFANLKRNRNQSFDWLQSFDGDFLMKNIRVLGSAALLVSALLTGCSHPQPVVYAPPRSTIERFRTRVITMASRQPDTMLKAVSLQLSLITRAGAILRCRLRVLRPIERASARGIHGSFIQYLLPVTDLDTASSYAPTDRQS